MLELHPVQAPGVPQGASCCCVRKMSVSTVFVPCVHIQNTQTDPLDSLKFGIFREEMRAFGKEFQCLLTLTGKKWHPAPNLNSFSCSAQTSHLIKHFPVSLKSLVLLFPSYSNYR